MLLINLKMMINFNVELPKTKTVGTRVKTLMSGKIRVAIVDSYTDKGFIVTITKHRERVKLLLPNKILNLNGHKLYSLPDNDKRKVWSVAHIAQDYDFSKPDIVKQYWSNLKPKLKIIVSINNDKIVGYEQYSR